jgi:hypothetical protein
MLMEQTLASANRDFKTNELTHNGFGGRAPTVDCYRSPVSGGVSPLSAAPLVTRYVQTEERATAQARTQEVVASSNPIGLSGNKPDEDSPPPPSPCSVRPLRERRLPASFWQEPNVPRARLGLTTTRELRGLAEANESYSDAIVKCNVAGLCCCAGSGGGGGGCCAGPTTDAGQSLHPLHLLQYLSSPSTTYCNGLQQPRPPVDLTALYLNGLYSNSSQQPLHDPHLSVAAAAAVASTVRRPIVAEPTLPFPVLPMPKSRLPPPVYGHRRHRHSADDGQLSTRLAVKCPTVASQPSAGSASLAPDEMLAGKFSVENRLLMDSLPTAAAWSTPVPDHGLDTVADVGFDSSFSASGCGGRANGVLYDSHARLAKFAGNDRREHSAILRDGTAAVALAAAYLHQQQRAGGGGGWYLNGSDQPRTSPTATDPGCTAPDRRCRGDARTSFVCGGSGSEAEESLRRLFSPISSSAFGSTATNYGLFSIWRAPQEALVATATGSELRGAHRYRPY